MEQRRNNNINDKSYENQGGVHPVHSQVRKIKQELEKDTIVDWLPGQPEMRPVLLREITSSRQISRSPLGLSGRPISVGDSY